MKRLALLTVFFYVCTFAAPPRAHAVAPVALIAAAAVGTAMMSASIGTYYAQNGVMPQYVTSTANAVASAADAVFQPSYLAKGVYHLFTPASLTTAKDYYLGKTAAIGAKLGDIIDFIKTSSDDAYSSLKSLVSNNTSETIDISNAKIGDIITVDGINYKLTSYALQGTTAAWPAYKSVWVVDDIIAFRKDTLTFNFYTNPQYTYGGVYVRDRYLAYAIPTTDSPTLNPSDSIDYAALEDALNQSNMDADVANDLRNSIASLPDSKVIPAPSVPETVADTRSSPSITTAELSAALQANTLATANAVAEQAAAIAAANPNDAAAQIAAAQATLEAAKAAEQIAADVASGSSDSPPATSITPEQIQAAVKEGIIEATQEIAENTPEPEPEPEPSYPVPTTWYTKTCDLSNGLGSCIDYQQVLNASTAFQSTALYQFPNLILQCLGYVEGDGCEYPPKISVDLFTRFSNGPIDIDLSPFESVVKVMKFFFSILCLVGTGKATMTLFE